MSPITDVRISGLPEIIISGPKWVHMARHGLKLCQDGATGSNIIFIYLPGPKTTLKNYFFFNFVGFWVGGMAEPFKFRRAVKVSQLRRRVGSRLF